MLARCARCQGTFTTDRYGRQSCPHCGSELILPDPNAPQPAPESSPPPPPAEGGQGWGPPSQDVQGGAGGAVPPPPQPPPPAAGGGGWSPLPPPPPPPQEEIPAPFTEIRQRGFFSAFFETWKLAAVEPQRFFARVRIDQIWYAVLFGVVAGWAGAAVAALFGWLGNAVMMDVMRQLTDSLPADQAEVFQRFAVMWGGGAALLRIVTAPIGMFLYVFLIAAIVHVMLLMFQGAARGFGATLTVVGYSCAVQLLNAVPGCGSMVAFVWQLVVLIIGMAAVHRCSTGKAAAAVLLPGVICCCCCVFSFSAVLGTVIQALQSGAAGTSNL